MPWRNAENWKFKILKYKDFITILFFSILLFIFSIRNIPTAEIPFIMNDEYGYWGNAAYIAGLDWSNVIERIPWYAPGYSFLLAPLFTIFNNVLTLYKAAVVMNAFWELITFLLLFLISNKVMKGFSTISKLVICFCITFYCGNIVHQNYAVPETLLYFLFTAAVYALTNLFITKRTKWCLVFTGILGYMYLVHMRNIGIIVAAGMVLLLLYYKKNITGKQLMICSIILLISIIIQTLLKSYFMDNLWNANEMVYGNGYKEALNTEDEWLVLTKKLFFGFCGKLFYICVSTAGLILYFFDLVIRNFSVKKELTLNRVLLLFLFFSFMAELLISAVFMKDLENVNQLLYGRYTEYMLLPVMLITIFNFAKREVTGLQSWCYIFGMQFLAIINKLGCELFSIKYQNIAINNIAVSRYFLKDGFEFHMAFLVSAAILLIIKMLCKRSRKYKWGMICLPLLIYWNILGNNVYVEFERNSACTEIKKDIVPLSNEINQLIGTDIKSYSIYTKLEENYIGTYYIESVQFMFPHNKVEILNSNQVQGNKYIIFYMTDKPIEKKDYDIKHYGTSGEFSYIIS